MWLSKGLFLALHKFQFHQVLLSNVSSCLGLKSIREGKGAWGVWKTLEILLSQGYVEEKAKVWACFGVLLCLFSGTVQI